jgi:hypothetical protein
MPAVRLGVSAEGSGSVGRGRHGFGGISTACAASSRARGEPAGSRRSQSAAPPVQPFPSQPPPVSRTDAEQRSIAQCLRIRQASVAGVLVFSPRLSPCAMTGHRRQTVPGGSPSRFRGSPQPMNPLLVRTAEASFCWCRGLGASPSARRRRAWKRWLGVRCPMSRRASRSACRCSFLTAWPWSPDLKTGIVVHLLRRIALPDNHVTTLRSDDLGPVYLCRTRPNARPSSTPILLAPSVRPSSGRRVGVRWLGRRRETSRARCQTMQQADAVPEPSRDLYFPHAGAALKRGALGSARGAMVSRWCTLTMALSDNQKPRTELGGDHARS